MDVRVEPLRRLNTEDLMLSICGGSLGLKGDQAGQSYRKSTLTIHWNI